MKKIFNYILAVTALLAFAPIAKAQDDYTIKNGIGVRKTISAPNLNGEYFITLESFVEGEVKITPKPIPADIVLVLDVSASMIRENMSSDAENEEYVLINNNQDGVSGRSLTVGWSYSAIDSNKYIEYPYGSGNFCQVKRADNNVRKLYFEYGGTTYWLTGGGTQENNGTGIIGGDWDANGRNTNGSIAKASEGTYNYGNSVTTTEPSAASGDNVVIWRGPLYEKTKTFTRLHALQNAVSTFLNIVYQKSTEDHLTNRISIVKFSGIYANDPDSITPGNHYSDTDAGGTTEVFQGWTDASDITEINKLIKDVKHLATGHGTSHDFGLHLAQKLLESLPKDTEPRSKTVVLFTDGVPWREADVMGDYQERDAAKIVDYAISTAYDIKQMIAFTSDEPDGTKKDHYTTVFTVGTLGATTPTNANNILNYCSSKYPQARSVANHGADAGGDYVHRAETAQDLDAVFTAIANSSSESSTSLDAETTTTVDIVSKSFMLPSGASTNVQVFTADCNGGKYVEQDGERVFVPKFASQVPDAALTESVVITKSSGSTKYDEVDVTGFDYTANFCGPRVDTQSGDTLGFVGKKLIVRFPVKMDPEALGGPNAPTNAPGSGIFADGQDEPIATFETPHVSLPYNIHITKTGLEKGESARFKIEKIVVQDAWITTDAEGKETINVPVNAQWDPMTTVLITADGVTTEPGIWVRGLPSTQAVGTAQKIVLYRVSEEDWSWSYDQKTNPMITDNSKIDNPFQFKNEKLNQIKIKVRHAESKARNVFKLNSEGGAVEYMDSKNERRKKAVTESN